MGKETLQTTAVTDDTDAGESSWAVYNRVSSANKAKLKAAILAQMTTSISAVQLEEASVGWMGSVDLYRNSLSERCDDIEIYGPVSPARGFRSDSTVNQV